MLSFLKFSIQPQQLCRPGTWKLVSMMLLTSFIILKFQSSSESPRKSISVDLEQSSFQNPASFESNKTGKNEFIDLQGPKLPIDVYLQSEQTEKNGFIDLQPERTKADATQSDDGIKSKVEFHNIPVVQEKKKTKPKRKKMPALSIEEMNQILLKSHLSSHVTFQQEQSASDLQILEAKAQIEQSLASKNDPNLYTSVFRNISMFKKSYEMMEKTLKVYVYKEGEKPIFHKPNLQGIYSSEGWFMKQLLSSQHFLVDDPSKAHLFYMPFSSSTLRFKFFIQGDHNHDRVIDFLKRYISLISTNHPFWNRTSGSDHFFVACHDWVPDVTVPTMGNSIAVICNADLAMGFKLGRDISLPETNVRSDRNPNGLIGGQPAKRRPILAFFAGRMHGYVRPLLLRHWENKEPDMKIFGVLKNHNSTVSYKAYMKSSKFCICPRGNDVNSPRIVEAILYECVPVIISDNFIPPFFDVLKWEAFSVIVKEEDIPRLRDILLSIPMNKYLALQATVKKVQRHFMWHGQPQKYDLFHMILHSVWLSRILQQT